MSAPDPHQVFHRTIEAVWTANLGREGRTAQQDLSQSVQQRSAHAAGLGVTTPNVVPASTAAFVSLIRTDQELNDVALAFLALRDSTGVHFAMFDVNAVEEWCKQNSSKCQ